MKSLEGMGKPWLSVSIKDCRVDTFRAGGPGGQRQNKVSSGVRIVHEPSGAVGESRDERSQLQNKKLAFRRMSTTQSLRSGLDGSPVMKQKLKRGYLK